MRAQAALENMIPANLFRCGLTADYSTACLTFLRTKFDIEDPDPADSVQAVSEFSTRMRALFCDGCILGDAKAVQADSEHAVGRSMTQIVYEQIDCPEPRLVC